MPDHDRTLDTPRSRKLFWIKLLSAMALILAGTFVLYRVVAIRALNQRVQAVRADGYPIEPEELNAWHPVPEGENAADVYARAFRAMSADEAIAQGVPVVSTVEGYVPGQPLDGEMAGRIEAYLTHQADALALLEEAARIEGSRFPGDYKEGINLLLPHLGALRRGARILRVRSIYDMHLGEHDRAIDRCITIIALGRSLEREPILISSLVSISIQMMAYEQVELLIATGRVSDAKLVELARAIEPIDVDEMVLRVMVGERCTGHGTFDNMGVLSSIAPGGASSRPVMVAYRAAGLLDIDHSCYLDLMREHVDYAEHPTWPVPATLDDDERIPRVCIVTRILLPALGAAHKTFFRAEARRRVILTAIAAERYRQQHGSLPTTLDGLVPDYLDAIHDDPFTGDPLRYRAEETGAIIYSLGDDNDDNAGRARDDEGNTMQEQTDIAFTFGGLQEKLWPREAEIEPVHE